MVREGAAGLGAVGFVVGLFAPSLLAATAIGAAVGSVAGRVLHKKTDSKIEQMAGATIPIGRRPDRGLSALGCGEGRARGDACDPEGGRRG
jgi:hypothetical protein